MLSKSLFGLESGSVGRGFSAFGLHTHSTQARLHGSGLGGFIREVKRGNDQPNNVSEDPCRKHRQYPVGT